MTMTTNLERERNADANRDPITGAPGSHPIGTGLGAAAGGIAAGAAVGTVAGPVGTMVGAVAGAVIGGLAGKGIAEKIDPTVEEAYWRDNYLARPYVDRSLAYNDYAPAYRYGWESRAANPGRKWDEIESDLERGWDKTKGASSLAWNQAKSATRDAWHRVEKAIPGDFDRDGR